MKGNAMMMEGSFLVSLLSHWYFFPTRRERKREKAQEVEREGRSCPKNLISQRERERDSSFLFLFLLSQLLFSIPFSLVRTMKMKAKVSQFPNDGK